MITSIGMTMKSITGIDDRDMRMVTIVVITISPPIFSMQRPVAIERFTYTEPVG